MLNSTNVKALFSHINQTSESKVIVIIVCVDLNLLWHSRTTIFGHQLGTELKYDRMMRNPVQFVREDGAVKLNEK